MDAAALATKLGLTEAKVSAALEKVRAAQKPPTPPAQGPSRPMPNARPARRPMVTALAKELGVSEAKVQAALDAIKADREASRKTELSTRLDAAVKAGKLSAADKASVLKAFDAGVLGGGRPSTLTARPAPARPSPARAWPGPRRAPAGAPARCQPPVPAPAARGGHPAYRGRGGPARRATGAGMPRGPGLDLVGHRPLWHTGPVA